MLLLSALGIFFALLVSLAVFLGLGKLVFGDPSADFLPLVSVGALSALVAALNLPTMLLSIRSLRGLPTEIQHASLFKPAVMAIGLWVLIMLTGFLFSRSEEPHILLALFTVPAVAIPIWWLVEFSRRRLPRSTPRCEWGALTIALTVAPVLIMLVEAMLLILVGVAIFIALSTQPGVFEELAAFTHGLDFLQDGMESMEKLMVSLSRNPVIASALFLVVGLVAPFTEELFKPMGVWFLLNRPLKDHEGFSLGLISGGAFALLESAGLVSQISTEDWLSAVALRATTGLLHIGLSGLVGYGITHSWNLKQFERSLLYLLLATLLHGAWNSLALLNGFATTPLPAAPQGLMGGFTGVLTLGLMAVVFVWVIVLTLRIRRRLRQDLAAEKVGESALPNNL